MSSQSKQSVSQTTSSTSPAQQTPNAEVSGSNELALLGFEDAQTAGLMEGLGVLDLYEATLGSDELGSGDESLWDQGMEVVTDATNSLLDFFDPSTSAQDLWAWVEEAGDEHAAPILERLAMERPSVIGELLGFAPITELLVRVGATLEQASLQAALASLEPSRLGEVLSASATAGVSEVISGALEGVESKVMLAALRTLDLDTLTQWVQTSMETASTFLQETLVAVWPEGVGFAVDAELAATFGVPLKLGLGLEAEVSHIGKGTLKFRRQGEAVEALDTGIGGGGFIGFGEKDETGKVGIGADWSADAEVGLKELITQEFEFPIFDDLAFLSLATTAVMVDGPIALASVLTGLFPSLSSSSYNTLSRAEVIQHNEASAGGGVGLKTSNEKTQESFRKDDGSDANSGELSEFWQVMAGIDGKVRGCLDESGWIETRTDRSGGEGAEVGELEIGGGIHALGELAANVPELPPIAALDNLLSHGVEAGAQAKVIWSYGNEGNAPSFTNPTFELVIGAKVDGVGVEVGLGHEDLAVGPQTVDETIDNLHGAHLSASIALGSELGSGLTEMAMIAGDVKSLFGVIEEPGAVLTVDGEVSFSGAIEPDTLKDIAREWVSLGAYSGPDAGKALRADIQSIFAGNPPSHLTGAVSQIAQALLETDTSFDLSAKVGLSLQGGGKLSGGAKAALDGGVGGFVTYNRSLYELLGADAKLSVEEVGGILMGTTILGPSEISVPTE